MKKTTKRAPRARTAQRRAPALPATAGADLRQLWLAGLGAVVTTSETAVELIDTLVARGRRQEPKTRAAAQRIVRDARQTIEGLASETGRRSRVALEDAMERLGVEKQPRSKNILHRLGDIAEALL